MRVLFLGSGGRVGKLLKAAWTDPKAVWHTRQSFDIMTDLPALRGAIAQCDVIVNLAGATHHGPSQIAGANTDLARRVLDNAADRPVFLLSSAAVYGEAVGDLREALNPTPTSEYGRDKADMEAMAQAHSAKSIILRLGNVAGADALLGVARTRYILDIFADGTHPSRSYIGPQVLATILAQLIDMCDKRPDTLPNILPNILNVSTARAVSMSDLLKAAGLPWVDRPAGPAAIAKVELNTTLLQSLVTMPDDAATPVSIVSDWLAVRDRT